MALVKKRDASKKDLSLVLSWVKNHGKTAAFDEINERVIELDSLYEIFMETHRDVLDVTGPSELDFQKVEGDDAASIYQEGRLAMVALMETLKNTPGPSGITLTVPKSSAPKTRSKTNDRGNKKKPLPTDPDAGGDFNWAEDVANNEIDNPPPSNGKHGAVNNNNIVEPNQREANNFAAGIIRVRGWATRMTAAETTIDMVKTRANLLEDYWQKFTAVAFAGDAVDFGELVDNTENNYLQAKSDLSALIGSYAPRNNNARAAGAVAPQQEIPLPRIEIPKFSGNFHTWLSFYDLFVSMVDNNQTLDGVKKMHYLRSCLEGEAEQLIRSYKVTDANYAEA